MLEKVGVKAVIEGLQPYLAGLGQMDKATNSLTKRMGKDLAFASTAAKVALAGAGVAAVGFAVKGLKMADSIEQAKLAFETLLGSAKAAEDRIKELNTFAAKTPFELPGIIEADRLLTTFGARSIETLTMVGDAAAGVGVGIEEVAFWFGRAYTAIQAGRPFGEALMRLQELGLVSGQARNKLEDLQKSGAAATEIIGVLQGELGRFNGLMEKQSQTLGGLLSTISDNFNLALAAIVKPFLPAFKRGLGAVIEYLDEHQKDLEDFADTLARTFESALPTALTAAKAAFQGFLDVFTWIITHRAIIIAAVVAIGASFAWAHPLLAVVAGTGGLVAALGLLEEGVGDLKRPLNEGERAAADFRLELLKLMKTVLEAALTVETFGLSSIPGLGDKIQEFLAEKGLSAVAEGLEDIDAQIAELQAGIDHFDATKIPDQFRAILAPAHDMGIALDEVAAKAVAMGNSFADGVDTLIRNLNRGLDAIEAFANASIAGMNSVISAMSNYIIRVMDATHAPQALKDSVRGLLDFGIAPLNIELGRIGPATKRAADGMQDYSSETGGAAGATEKLLDPLKELTDTFDSLTGYVDNYTSALDRLLGLPTVESAQEDLELARLRLRAFDLEEAAERGKLARQKEIASLQDRLNQIQGKGNDLLEKKLAAQIAGLEKGESPAERELRIINDQIDAVERLQRRRQLEHDIVRAEAELANQTLLTDYGIEQLVGRILGQLPGVTSEAENVVSQMLQWLGASEDISAIYARIYLQLQDIAALQATLGLTAAPSFQYGGIVPGPIGEPQMILAHGGEQVIPASQVFNMPLNLNIASATDWTMVRQIAHAELDSALDRARTDAFKGGNPLGSGIG